MQIGHAGTLDPAATGLLVVCVGLACKRVSTGRPLLAPYGLRAVVTQVGDGRQGRGRSGVAACSRRRSGCRAGRSLEGSVQTQLGLQGPY